MWESFLLYASIFIMAATPWLELLLVIPIGIGMGLHPIPVAIVTFVGNALPVFIIIFLYNGIMKWWERRKKKKQNENETEEEKGKKNKRGDRAKRIFQKYGLPGLALLGPAVTGIHLATLIAMSFRARKINIMIWMNVSLIIWTIVMTVASVHGIDWFTSLF